MKTVVVPFPGECFVYRCAPWWQPWKRSFGGAQMLGIASEHGLVHVRLFGDDVDIRHVPILASRVAPYVHENLGRAPLPEGFTASIQEWRELYASGEADAFGLPIHRVGDIVLETIGPDASRPAEGGLLVASAYPVRSPEGDTRTVRAIVVP